MHEPRHLFRCEVPTFKHRPTVQIGDAFPISAPVDLHIAPFSPAEEGCTLASCSTMGTTQSVRMEMEVYPSQTSLTVHQVYNWTIHAL